MDKTTVSRSLERSYANGSGDIVIVSAFPVRKDSIFRGKLEAFLGGSKNECGPERATAAPGRMRAEIFSPLSLSRLKPEVRQRRSNFIFNSRFPSCVPC